MRGAAKASHAMMSVTEAAMGASLVLEGVILSSERRLNTGTIIPEIAR